MESDIEKLTHQQQALMEFAQRAPGAGTKQVLLDDALGVALRVVGADFGALWELSSDATHLILRAGVGWQPGHVGHERIALFADSTATVACRSRKELFVDDLLAQTRFRESNLLLAHEVRGCVDVPVMGPDGPIGVIGLGNRSADGFGQLEACFLMALAGALSGWIMLAISREQDAQASAAVRQVEKEIVTALDTPALLERMCRLTVTTLDSDACETLLVEPGWCGLRSCAHYGRVPGGTSPAENQMTGEAVTELIELLVRDGAVWMPAGDVRSPLVSTPDPVSVLFFLLNRGGRPFAVQCVSFRGATRQSAASLERTATDVGRLASTLLEYSRVVDELARVSRMKSDFVATMSHELRTPLHVIMGYNDLLVERVLGELTPEQEESLTQVGDRTRELLALITATLDLSEFESGSMLEDVDLTVMFKDLESEGRLIWQKPSVAFEWYVDPSLPTIRTDRARLRVVLENLLDNALRFTEAGTVRLEAKSDSSNVVINVRDTGVGIDADTLPFIFDPFQGLESILRKQPGLKRFGLYAVRRLLGMLGGSITVETAPARGSEFRICVPFDATHQSLHLG